MYWIKRNRTLIFSTSHDNSAYDHNNEVLEYTNESRMLYIRANSVFREYKKYWPCVGVYRYSNIRSRLGVGDSICDIQKYGGGCDHFCDFGNNGARSV